MDSKETIPSLTYSEPLRQSSINVCQKCKRKFLYKYRWSLYPKKVAVSPAANAGKMVHWLLEHGPDSVSEFETNLQEKAQEMETMIDQGLDPFGEIADRIKQLRDQANKAKVICQITWDRFGENPDEEVLCKEREISTGIILTDASGDLHEILLEGVIDKLIRSRKSGRIWARDFKTSSRDPLFTLTGYQFSTQCRLYRLLAEAFLFGEAVSKDPEYISREQIGDNPQVFGFCVDWMALPNIIMSGADRDYKEYEHTFTRGARKGETEIRRDYEGEPKFENYLNRCKQWYKDKGDEVFVSQAIAYTEDVIPKELYSALLVTWAYTNCDPDPELFPRDITATACKAYERQCEYYPLCSSDYSVWPSLMETAYQFKTPEQVKEEIQGKDKINE